MGKYAGLGLKIAAAVLAAAGAASDEELEGVEADLNEMKEDLAAAKATGAETDADQNSRLDEIEEGLQSIIENLGAISQVSPAEPVETDEEPATGDAPDGDGGDTLPDEVDVDTTEPTDGTAGDTAETPGDAAPTA